MNEVSKPLLGILVTVSLVGGHIERTLTEECLRIRRHIGQIIHHNKHFDHGSQRIEESQLYCPLVRNPVAFFAQVYVTLQKNDSDE